MAGSMSIPNIPEYVLELVEQRLADRVHDRVHKRITRLYAAVATVLLAVGGWTIYDVDEVVQKLIQHSSGARKPDKSQLVSLSSSLTEIADSIQERDRQLENSGRLTVFFQFAGMPNDLARGISVELQSMGYVVPGEVRENMNADTREVRYFRVEDLEQAQRLADDASAALASIGLGDFRVEPKAMTGWKGAKPRAQRLELWLSVPEHTRPRELTLSRS
jgi:hypothetical protein